MGPISFQDDSILLRNTIRKKNPVNVMSQGSRYASTVNLSTLAANKNSLYHFSSLDSEILSSDSLVNATTDGSR